MTSQADYRTHVRVVRQPNHVDTLPSVHIVLPEGGWNWGEEVEVVVRHLPPPIPPTPGPRRGRWSRGWWRRLLLSFERR